MKLIRKLIGKLTLPKDVYVDMMGYYWVDDFWNLENIHYEYYYQSIEQNRFGKWVRCSCFLGTYKPLKKLIK
jgi:hypothetical protein